MHKNHAVVSRLNAKLLCDMTTWHRCKPLNMNSIYESGRLLMAFVMMRDKTALLSLLCKS